MEEKKVKFACSLDCFDGCSMTATVRAGKVLKIEGDKEHPLTRGSICEKGRKHLERMYHTERILKPRRRYKDTWIDISWEDALDEIARKLLDAKEKYGASSVMYFNDSGYTGLSKTVDEMFFNYYGGVTIPRGSLCWAAGIKAQKYDFGNSRANYPEDHAHAKGIIIWGRNPYNTNIHLMPLLLKAKEKGAYISVIDPIRTKSADFAHEHISIKPATDGALALGMANIIIHEGLIDKEFINDYVIGFEEFKAYVRYFTLEKTSEITGIPSDTIRNLAISYATTKPSCIILGYGMQRYSNGGNNIRCIDALGAITGNIGISGGGVNYANKLFSKYIGGEVKKSTLFSQDTRSFSKVKMGEFLESAKEPPIKCLFVMKANPIVQAPDINRTMEAIKKVEYKVVIDMFMTDTAQLADLVLPCTSVLEEEDIIISSMFTNYCNYSHRVIEPPAGLIGEFELYRCLARKMNLQSYPDIDQEEFLRRAINPLTESFGITLEDLKKGPFTIPDQQIAWKNRRFETPSGKFELYSTTALQDGLSPLPSYIEAAKGEREFPLRLITPHLKDSLHSQHFAFIDRIPTVYLNKNTLNTYNLVEGKKAVVKSKQGSIEVTVKINNAVGEELLMIYQGWWHKSGSVNFLTEARHSDMGEQAAYYDCFCRIMAIEE